MLNISNTNVSCEFSLPNPPSGLVLNPELVQVVYMPVVGTEQQIPRTSNDVGCSGANGGWYFDNPSKPTKITLCPCSFANLAAGIIETRFGCRPPVSLN
jgi:hypothetical protein